eukprot:403367353
MNFNNYLDQEAVRKNSKYSNPQGSSNYGSVAGDSQNNDDSAEQQLETPNFDSHSEQSYQQSKKYRTQQEKNKKSSSMTSSQFDGLRDDKEYVYRVQLQEDLLDSYKKKQPEHMKDEYYLTRNQNKKFQDQNGSFDNSYTNKILQSSNFFSQLTTNLSYLINDIRKRDRQFQIGLISVFMVVCFTTLLTSFLNSTPSLFLMVAQSNAGDFDITMTALTQTKQFKSGHGNFYLDGFDDFEQETMQPFERAQKKDQIASMKETVTSKIFESPVPLMNLTAVNLHVHNISDITGAYPRWMGLAQVANPNSLQLGDTGSFIAYGDQKLERDIGVANGFPTDLMTKDDAIVSRDLLDIFDLGLGDQILIKYDFLSFLPGQIQTYQSIIFEDIKQEDKINNRTRGQLFLIALNVNPNIKYGEVKQLMQRSFGIQFDQVTGNVGLIMGYTDQTPFSIMLDDLFSQLSKEDFILEKNYTVIAEVDNTFGKWPRAFGNAIFLDSTYLIDNTLEMLYENTKNFILRTNNNFQLVFQTTNFYNLMKVMAQNVSISEYAMMVNLQVEDRMRKYSQNDGAEIMDAIIKAYQHKAVFETSSGIMMIREKTKNIDTMKAMLSSLFINIILFIFVLAFILNQSLVQSDVEERTYEFAMLRTLGYRKNQLVQLLSFQTLFFSIPGMIFGFIVMTLILYTLKLVIYDATKFSIYQEIDTATILVAVLMGLVAPLVANYVPARQAMSKSLRDSLDVYRKTIDDFTVTMTKLENIGISPIQMLVGLMLTVFGFIVYYFIPSSLLAMDFDLFFLLILLVLFTMVIGMSMITQSFVAPLEKSVLWFIMLIRPEDRKLKPIVDKNMRSHKTRNMKTSMMFTMTVCFLMYSSTSFAELEYMIFSLTGAIIGADLALFRSNSLGGMPISLDEKTLNEYFNQNMYDPIQNPSGLITDYSYQAQTVNEVLVDPSNNDKLDIYIGMRGQSQYKVKLYAMPRDHLEVQGTEYFYPTQVWDGSGTMNKTYSQNQMMELLYDLGDISTKAEISDRIGLNSQTNVIPEAFVGLLPIQAGEDIILCLSEKFCTDPYRAKIVGTIKRIPGLFDVSGYTPAAFIEPGCIISFPQMQFLISQFTSQSVKAKQNYEKYMATQPQGSSYQIPKKAVYVQVKEDASTKDINKLKNTIVKIAGETNVFAFDVRQFNKSLQEYLVLLYLISGIISTILFILTFFQLIVSISSNIRDDEWELGVLRAIGLKKNDIMKLTLYESIAGILSSTFLGFVIGVISATAMTALFMAIVELPFKLLLSYSSIMLMIGMTVVTITLGTYMGVKQINGKSITSALKGL